MMTRPTLPVTSGVEADSPGAASQQDQTPGKGVPVWRPPRSTAAPAPRSSARTLSTAETPLHREGTGCETVLRSRGRQSRCLWPDQLAERGGPRTPSLGSNNLPERLTEVRKTRLLIRSRVCSKGS